VNLTGRKTIEVWGLSLRLFHWILVVSFLASWWSMGRDIRVHILAGSVIVGLLLYRFIWGFIGEKHALFTSFKPSFLAVKQHFVDLLGLRGRADVGHTPIGSLMIFALLTSLFMLALSGLSLIGLQMNVGVFAGLEANYDTELLIQSIHEWCFEALWVLVVIHLAGVLVESLLQRSNIIKAMFTGKKIIKEAKDL